MAKKKTKKASKKKAPKKKATKKKAKKKGKLKARTFKVECPNCGNTGRNRDEPIKFCQWIPTFFTVLAARDDTLYVDYNDYHDAREESKDSHLFCDACNHCWPLPAWVSDNSIDDCDGPTFADEAEEEAGEFEGDEDDDE
jgi:hypothetical protein